MPPRTVQRSGFAARRTRTSGTLVDDKASQVTIASGPRAARHLTSRFAELRGGAIPGTLPKPRSGLLAFSMVWSGSTHIN